MLAHSGCNVRRAASQRPAARQAAGVRTILGHRLVRSARQQHIAAGAAGANVQAADKLTLPALVPLDGAFKEKGVGSIPLQWRADVAAAACGPPMRPTCCRMPAWMWASIDTRPLQNIMGCSTGSHAHMARRAGAQATALALLTSPPPGPTCPPAPCPHAPLPTLPLGRPYTQLPTRRPTPSAPMPTGWFRGASWWGATLTWSQTAALRGRRARKCCSRSWGQVSTLLSACRCELLMGQRAVRGSPELHHAWQGAAWLQGVWIAPGDWRSPWVHEPARSTPAPGVPRGGTSPP